MLRIVYVKIKEEIRWGLKKLVTLQPLKEYYIYLYYPLSSICS
jgi:hypothetical protein